MSTEFALQKFVYSTLTGNAAVTALVDGRVYDGKQPEGAQMPYVRFGPHDLTEADAECIVADNHTMQLDIWSSDPAGSEEAKRVGSAIKKALHDAQTNLESGANTTLRVTARRYFRDTNPEYTHGVVIVTATIEEVE